MLVAAAYLANPFKWKHAISAELRDRYVLCNVLMYPPPPPPAVEALTVLCVLWTVKGTHKTVNMAHVGQSKPDSGLGLKVRVAYLANPFEWKHAISAELRDKYVLCNVLM